MSTSVQIVVHGAPATQGSKKAFIRGKKVVMVEAASLAGCGRSCGTTRDWPRMGHLGRRAVSVTGTIQLRRPASTKFSDFPEGPPNLDKLQRAIGDALTKSKVITDWGSRQQDKKKAPRSVRSRGLSGGEWGI